VDEDLNDEEEFDESDKLTQNNEAPEYRRLIAIHAGKPKGGLEECLKVDPDKVRRLSLSEQQLEKAAINHGKQIVRYCSLLPASPFKAELVCMWLKPPCLNE